MPDLKLVLEDGMKLEESFDWLEKAGDPAVSAFLGKEDEILLSSRTKWKSSDQLTALLGETVDLQVGTTPIFRRSSFYFIRYVEREQSQCLCRWAHLGGVEEVEINFSLLLGGGEVAIDIWHFSDCERYLAFSFSEHGADQQSLRIYDFQNGNLLSDTLDDLRFPEVAWNPDSGSFLYNRYHPYGDKLKIGGYTVLLHFLGTAQSDDQIVEDFRGIASALPLPLRQFRSPLCFIFSILGTSFKNRLSWREASSDKPFRIIQDFGVGKTEPVFCDVFDDHWRVIARTSVGADRGKVVRFSLSNESETNTADFFDLVSEQDHVLNGVVANAHSVVCTYDTLAGSVVTTSDTQSGSTCKLKTRSHEYISCGSELDCVHGFLATGYLPTGNIELLQVSLVTQEIKSISLNSQKDIKFTAQTSNVVCADSIGVPVTTCWFDDYVDIKNRPTLLHVYGGFGFSLHLGFNAFATAWMKMGGVYAIAHVRGGGEFGTSWHDQGKGQNKPKAIQDLIDCASFLTSKSIAGKIACMGASHGGFVVTAALNVAPDLFDAAIADVPVTDLVALASQSTGHETIDEYGETPAQRFALSPFHGIKQQSYPPTLVITASHDERVPPWHSYKYVAQRRLKNSSDNVFLWRVEDGGHSGPVSKASQLEEDSVKLEFLRYYLLSGQG